MAGASAVGGTGEALGATLGEDVQPLVDTLDVASTKSVHVIWKIKLTVIQLYTGSVVKDQATADEDTSLKDRGLQAISKYTFTIKKKNK